MLSVSLAIESFLRKVKGEWEGEEETKGKREREREREDFFLVPLTKSEKVTVSNPGNH